MCLLATATGDAPESFLRAYTALAEMDMRLSHLALFPMPNLEDVRGHLLRQDVIRWAAAAWRRELPYDLEPAFQDLTTALEHWENEVFAYFDHPITNAYTESLNSLIRLTNRVGRGYSFAAIRAKLLYAVDWRLRARPALRQLSNRGQRREHPSRRGKGNLARPPGS
jgi:Transposase